MVAEEPQGQMGQEGLACQNKGNVLAEERHVTLPRVKGVCMCLWQGQICDSKGALSRPPGYADHISQRTSIAPNVETWHKGEATFEGTQARPTSRATPSAVA